MEIVKPASVQRFKLYGTGALIAGLILLAGWHCPFRFITGLPCPGCGMTRALLALLKGHLAESIACNWMLIPTGGLAVLWWFNRHNRKRADLIVGFWIALMFIAWLPRFIPLLIERFF